MDRRKIRRGMTSAQAIKALSIGNYDAEKVCQMLFKNAPRIDPDDFLEGWGPLRDLDALGIRGGRITRLYVKVCGGNLATMIAVLRAWQLGLDIEVTPYMIKVAIDYGTGLDLEVIMRAVRSELPNFNPD